MRTVTLLATNDTTLKHRFHPIQYGGQYRVTVATDVDDAIPSKPFLYIAPPLLPPHQLNVVLNESGYIIYWQEHDLPEAISNKSKYYEVLVSEGESKINLTTAKVFKAQQPPFMFNDAKLDVIYSFAVRLVMESGFKSELSEIASVKNFRCKFTYPR